MDLLKRLQKYFIAIAVCKVQQFGYDYSGKSCGIPLVNSVKGAALLLSNCLSKMCLPCHYQSYFIFYGRYVFPQQQKFWSGSLIPFIHHVMNSLFVSNKERRV